MGKIETVFKAEATRLARKEIRPLVEPLQRQVRQLARQVRTLAAEVQRLTRLTARQEETRIKTMGNLTAPATDAKAARMSGGLIKKLRKKIGVTQGQLAGLVGVSAAAVQSWEQNIAKPGGDNRDSLVTLRQMGRRDIAKLLADKGVAEAGRKPRTDPISVKAARTPATPKRTPKKAAKKTRRVRK